MAYERGDNVKKLFFLTLLVLLLAGNTFSIVRAEAPIDVSIVQLIATPTAFDGKLVRVIGFIHLEFEGNELYLHKEDDTHSIYINGIWVDLPRERMRASMSLNLSYVAITGTFDSTHRGHNGSTSGTITKIQNIEAWSKKAPGR